MNVLNGAFPPLAISTIVSGVLLSLARNGACCSTTG